MQALLGHRQMGKVVVIGTVGILVLLVIGAVRLVTGSYFAGVIVLLSLLWWLLRQVGGFVMFPGSFFFTRSDIEMRYSREIGTRMVSLFNAIHALTNLINQRRFDPFQSHFDYAVVVDRHVRAMISMLSMFQGSLSERKTALLEHYRSLLGILEARDGQRVSICDLIARPRLIPAINDSHLIFYLEAMVEACDVVKKIAEVLKSYVPPAGGVELWKFRISEENLFQIRFGFHSWGALFEFQLFTVHSTGHAHIESAIIHAQKRRVNEQEQAQPVNPSRKTVLFCNPNGVFIQFFGADNEYIRNYLKMGYKVILWNYRGYGQSTGTPSISRAQEDALSVYRFYLARGYQIEIVHGYSIGGAAAVGLMQKLGGQPEGVKVLIVDRSFSSIGEMSAEFGKAFHRLTRIIFFNDNIDLSKQFQGVSCRKLLIWDYCDEVIPDRASVKNRIIKRRKTQGSRGRPAEEDRLRLAEEVSSLSPQDIVPFEEVARQLHWTLDALLELRRHNSQNSEKELKDFIDEREASASTTVGVEDSSFEGVIKMVGKVDGGGIQLFHNLTQLEEIRTNKPEYLQHICESYVLGLVCYGSYFPLRPILHDHEAIKQQTLAKIDLLLQQLAQRFSIATSTQAYSQNPDPSPSQIHQNLLSIFQRIRQLVEDCFCEEWFRLHGSLLPTNNGHNNPLTRSELAILNSFIRQGGQEII